MTALNSKIPFDKNKTFKVISQRKSTYFFLKRRGKRIIFFLIHFFVADRRKKRKLQIFLLLCRQFFVHLYPRGGVQKLSIRNIVFGNFYFKFFDLGILTMFAELLQILNQILRVNKKINLRRHSKGTNEFLVVSEAY